jgi:hypothetical protein
MNNAVKAPKTKNELTTRRAIRNGLSQVLLSVDPLLLALLTAAPWTLIGSARPPTADDEGEGAEGGGEDGDGAGGGGGGGGGGAGEEAGLVACGDGEAAAVAGPEKPGGRALPDTRGWRCEVGWLVCFAMPQACKQESTPCAILLGI